MYEWVLEKRKNDDATNLYDLDPHRFENEVDSIREIMWSATLGCFYGIPTFITIGIVVYKLAQS